MSGATDSEAAPVSVKGRRSRGVEYAIILVLIALVALAAWFQEPIGAFFSLRMWDREAPSRAVFSFLDAGKAGDKAKADAVLAATAYQPLNVAGKWEGYSVTLPGGANMRFRFEDLDPPGGERKARTEYITIGRGAALVYLPNRDGDEVKYRLEIHEDGWKIAEILWGRHGAPPPSPGRGPAGGGAAGGGGRDGPTGVGPAGR